MIFEPHVSNIKNDNVAVAIGVMTTERAITRSNRQTTTTSQLMHLIYLLQIEQKH